MNELKISPKLGEKLRLLALLCKILGEIRRQMRVHSCKGLLSDKQLDMLEVITRVYRQHKSHFKSGDSCKSIPNRIVSLKNLISDRLMGSHSLRTSHSMHSMRVQD